MKEISYNDGMASRSRHSMLVLFDPETNLMWEWKGDIPGFCVTKTSSSNKNGKWSSTTYTILLHERLQSFKWTQDWDEGTYTGGYNTLEDCFQWFKGQSGWDNLTIEAFDAFIKARLSAAAKRFAESKAKLEIVADNALLLALKAQQEVKEQISQEIKVREESQAAQEINRRVEIVVGKLANKGSMSLEELQALYNEL